MKRLTHLFILAAVVASALLCACRDASRRSLTPWESPLAASDSLMRAVDDEMAGEARMSVINPILDKIDSLAQASAQPQMKARSLYQQARFHHINGRDSLGLPAIREAISLADSAAYPYDMARFQNLYLKDLFEEQTDRFSQLKKSLSIYIAANDSFRVSETFNRIGVFYRGVYDYGKAAEYYGKSRQWISPSQTDILFKLEFNRALLYKAEGNRDSMKVVFKRLLENPVAEEYPKLHCIILENNYRLFGGVEHLRKAYALEMAMTEGEPGYYYPTETASLLTKYFKRKQMLDSAAWYAHVATAGMQSLQPEAEEAPRIISQYYQVAGMQDSAKFYEEIANGLLHEMMVAQTANNIQREKYAGQISLIDRQIEEKAHATRISTWGLITCVAALLVLAAFIVWITIRRKRHPSPAQLVEGPRVTARRK